MINYSIIIPHKNIPDLLQRCLDSIPIHDDLETIIVDDNSDPSIVDFENFPGAHRSNTKIIYTKEGKGAGYARNIGLQYAEGKWILFADADDFFCPNLLEKIDSYKDSNLNLVYFKTTCKNSSNLNLVGLRQKLCDQYNRNIDDYNNKIISFRKTILSFGTPWGKLVRKQFLEENKITFEEVPFSNDIRWTTLIAIHSTENSFLCSNGILYCLTDRDTSLYHTNDYNALACRFLVFLGQDKLLKDNGYEDISPFHTPYFIEKARLLGLSKFIAFLRIITKNSKEIPPVYNIEKKLNFKKPFLYFFIQTIKQLFHQQFHL